MEVLHFHKKELNVFDADHINLAYEQESLSSYINHPFSKDNFAIQLKEKKSNFDLESRAVLVDAIRSSYANVELSGGVSDNIEALLDGNTFTITTGHQLSLFTGPLYFVLKILHVIKLATELSESYPDARFVPVFWMASEDHDFEEIQSLNLFNQRLVWDSSEKGPVGRFGLNGLERIRSEIAQLYTNHPDSEIHELLKLYDGSNYGQATLQLLHAVFKKYGLVVIDADNSSLKKLFSATIEKELVEQFSYAAVSKTSESLREQGIKTQVNPRELNLFYIKKGLRSRIEKKGDQFYIEGVGELSKEEILAQLHQTPEAFSPNVVLRPLYQETILPNLAYIGGGSEMLYWLQLKGVFDAVNCTYPLIGIRNSLLLLDEAISKKTNKLNLNHQDLFKNVEQIKKEYIEQHSGEEIGLDKLDDVSKQFAAILNTSINNMNPSMESYGAAEIAKLNKQIEGIRAKLVKMAKTKNEEAMKSIDHIKERLFPEGKLQERSVNFFTFCPDGNFAARLDTLYACIDPMVNDFIVVREFKPMK